MDEDWKAGACLNHMSREERGGSWDLREATRQLFRRFLISIGLLETIARAAEKEQVELNLHVVISESIHNS